MCMVTVLLCENALESQIAIFHCNNLIHVYMYTAVQIKCIYNAAHLSI